jgi:hypothetical protein
MNYGYVDVNVVYCECICMNIGYCKCFEFLAVELAFPVIVFSNSRLIYNGYGWAIVH